MTFHYVNETHRSAFNPKFWGIGKLLDIKYMLNMTKPYGVNEEMCSVLCSIYSMYAVSIYHWLDA